MDWILVTKWYYTNMPVSFDFYDSFIAMDLCSKTREWTMILLFIRNIFLSYTHTYISYIYICTHYYIYKDLNDQIYIFVFHPQFLAHRSTNPQNFLSNKSNESIFYHNIWSVVLSSLNLSERLRWNRCLVIHSKPLSITTQFILMRWHWESTYGWGWLLGESTMWLEGWNLQSHLPDLWRVKRDWWLNQLPVAND